MSENANSPKQSGVQQSNRVSETEFHSVYATMQQDQQSHSTKAKIASDLTLFPPSSPPQKKKAMSNNWRKDSVKRKTVQPRKSVRLPEPEHLEYNPFEKKYNRGRKPICARTRHRDRDFTSSEDSIPSGRRAVSTTLPAEPLSTDDWDSNVDVNPSKIFE